MLAIGLISGTSADGVDAALVEIRPHGNRLRAHARQWLTMEYPPALREAVLRVAGGAPTTAGEICRLNVAVAESFAQAATQVCADACIPLSAVEVIGSHGQTIWHEPAPTGGGALYPASTLQIGQPQVIAERTSVTTVGDFRARDMAVGGQGAPLVPMVDYLLFSDAQEGRILLNIGGIANITALPAGGEPEGVAGFDTGPGNMLLDGLVNSLSGGELAYDRDGAWARRGRPDAALLSALLDEPYYRLKPPKSTGRELFGADYLRKCVAMAKARGVSDADLVATVTALTAATIAGAIEEFVLPGGGLQVVIAAGGGAHNPAMMDDLGARLAAHGLRLTTADQYGVPVDGKEAVAFAVLAYLTIAGRPGNLPSVTGARKPVVLGVTAPGGDNRR